MHNYTKPEQLERWSFLWSEVRLVLAAIALFLGGIPPVLYLIRVPGLYNTISSLLTVAWIISGLVSVYMLYRWNGNGMRLFGMKNKRDTTTFFVNIVSGLNLGIAGLIGKNIGMSISYNYFIFVIIGLLYLYSAFHLHKRWRANGERVF